MNLYMVIGDSRISGLQYYINRANTGTIPIHVLSCSGKGIQELTSIIESQTKNHPYARVILAGGICDCTQRNEDSRNISDKFIFNFDSSTELIDHLYTLFKDSSRDLSRNRPNVKVSYSELIGMDMERSLYTRNPTLEQQIILNNSIMDINTKIVSINEENNVPTPWIVKRVHIIRKNGVHHQYERLSDGIHWDDNLKSICAQKFVDVIYKMQ